MTSKSKTQFEADQMVLCNVLVDERLLAYYGAC